MTAQKPQELPAYAGQIQELDREPKAQNRKLPAFAAVFLLLAGIVLPVFLGKNFDFPDSRTRADLAYFWLFCGKSERIEKTSDWQPNFTVKCCLCSAVRNHCPDML